MSRRLAIRVGAVLVLLLFVGLGTAGARQIFSEQQAHSHLDRARESAQAALLKARREGLTSRQLAPFRQNFSTLSSDRAPSSAPFVGSETVNFYNRQARSFRRLAAQILGEIQVVARQDKAEATVALDRSKALIQTASSLDIPIAPYESSVKALQLSFSAAKTPLQFVRLRQSVINVFASLQAAVTHREAYAASLLKSAGGDVSKIVSMAQAEAQSASVDLLLLSALQKPAPIGQSQLGAGMAAVQDANITRVAALKEAELHDLVQQLESQASRSIPPKVILVSTEKQWAYLYQNGKQIYDTPVTTGGPELPTDHGVFHIYEKVTPFVFHSPWPKSSPYYYPPTPITYWMPFDGGQGLHDASWRSNFGPGSNLQPTDLGTGVYILGTHGCVNLPTAAAQFVWNWAPLGTTVVVT